MATTLRQERIPKAAFGMVGGSGTLSSDFPRHVQDADVEILEEELRFETPYGISPVLRLFRVEERRVLACRMHGWRSGVTRADASRQVFWVFREAGVSCVLSEGGVGTVNRLLGVRDLVVPDDYLDLTVRKDVMLDGRYLLVMRDAPTYAACCSIRQGSILRGASLTAARMPARTAATLKALPKSPC